MPVLNMFIGCVMTNKEREKVFPDNWQSHVARANKAKGRVQFTVGQGQLFNMTRSAGRAACNGSRIAKAKQGGALRDKSQQLDLPLFMCATSCQGNIAQCFASLRTIPA